MKIKRDCGCGAGGKEVTEKILKDYVFYVISTANQTKKDRAFIVEGNELTDLQLSAAISIEKEIIRIVKVGETNINGIISDILQRA